MNITRLHLIFFSPVFHTRVITRMLGARLNAELGLAETPVEHDITDYSQASPSLRFGPEDLVILASPVYGGRLPYPCRTASDAVRRRKTPALLVVSYGNRAFEDALLEMKDIVEKQKFLPSRPQPVLQNTALLPSMPQDAPTPMTKRPTPPFPPPSKRSWTALIPVCPIRFPYRGIIPIVCTGNLPCPRQSTNAVQSAACALRPAPPMPFQKRSRTK